MKFFTWLRNLFFCSPDDLTFPISTARPKKRKNPLRRTKKRGIQRGRIKRGINRDRGVQRFINECLVFSPAQTTQKELLYSEYVDWCISKNLMFLESRGFFQAFCYFCENKAIYPSHPKDKGPSYSGVGVSSILYRKG